MPTRAEVARRLGKSIGAVRYLEGKALHPQRDAEGVWRFDPSEIEALAPGPTIELSPGKLAARACQLFRDGKTIVDVVIALEQPFDVVQGIHRAFAEDSGTLYVPPAVAEKMAEICEVDQATPEIVLQVLASNSRRLAELSAAKHGARLGAAMQPGKKRP